jgi:hypothetical protein
MAVLLEVEPTSGVTDAVPPDQENFATLEKTLRCVDGSQVRNYHGVLDFKPKG